MIANGRRLYRIGDSAKSHTALGRICHLCREPFQPLQWVFSKTYGRGRHRGCKTNYYHRGCADKVHLL